MDGSRNGIFPSIFSEFCIWSELFCICSGFFTAFEPAHKCALLCLGLRPLIQWMHAYVHSFSFFLFFFVCALSFFTFPFLFFNCQHVLFIFYFKFFVCLEFFFLLHFFLILSTYIYFFCFSLCVCVEFFLFHFFFNTQHDIIKCMVSQ